MRHARADRDSRFAPVTVGHWCCTAKRALARAPCWTVWSEQAAEDCRVLRAAGVESEMELAFATLHQLCAPMLGRLDDLPEPQRGALRTAFGISAGPPPDRFLVAMAVLSLLSDVADERPLLLLIDDEQWLDHASAEVLALIAGRLKAESVAIVYTAAYRAPTLPAFRAYRSPAWRRTTRWRCSMRS